MMSDPRLKLELALRPGMLFLGNGGVEKWVSTVGGYCFTQDTVTAKPHLDADGLYFDGGDSLVVSSFPNVATWSNWTIEGWVYPTAFISVNTILHLHNGSYTGIHLWANSSGKLIIDDGITGQTPSATGVSLNDWWHIRAVRTGSTTTISLNGSQVLSNGFTPSTVSAINIAENKYTPAYRLTGRLAQISIYDAALPISFPLPPRSQLAMPLSSPPPLTIPTFNSGFQFRGGL